MIRNRIYHWNCSKFADWLRGTKKPYALTLEEWEDWKKKQKAKNPLRFWLSEVCLNKLQNILFFPFDLFDSFRAYCRNRFVSKTHHLKTGLKPGEYHELDTRILHGLFNELKYFVEVELAWMQTLQDKNYKFKKGKCAEAGLAYLDWASNLKMEFLDKEDPDYGTPSEQAKAAKKIGDLYIWWLNRDKRPDPFIFWEECSKKENRSECHDELEKIEEKYDNEDTEMLIELIKIRKHLWT